MDNSSKAASNLLKQNNNTGIKLQVKNKEQWLHKGHWSITNHMQYSSPEGLP